MFLSTLAWICALLAVALIWRTNKGVVINRSGIKRATKKTLVLDLDETLVHSRIHEPDHYNYAISLTFDDAPFTFYVSERPHVHTFLREVAQLYEVVIFTASMQEYADPVINQLDPHDQYFTRRLYRESCTFHEDHFLKDLHALGFDMCHTLIVDNSPISYSLNRENAVPIDSYTGLEARDEALIALLPILRALVHVHDVRAVLGLQQLRL